MASAQLSATDPFTAVPVPATWSENDDGESPTRRDDAESTPDLVDHVDGRLGVETDAALAHALLSAALADVAPREVLERVLSAVDAVLLEPPAVASFPSDMAPVTTLSGVFDKRRASAAAASCLDLSNEVVSNEAVSNEAVSNEAVSNEAVSNEAVSNEALSNQEVHLHPAFDGGMARHRAAQQEAVTLESDMDVLDGDVLDGDVLDGDVLDADVLDADVLDGDIVAGVGRVFTPAMGAPTMVGHATQQGVPWSGTARNGAAPLGLRSSGVAWRSVASGTVASSSATSSGATSSGATSSSAASKGAAGSSPATVGPATVGPASIGAAIAPTDIGSHLAGSPMASSPIASPVAVSATASAFIVGSPIVGSPIVGSPIVGSPIVGSPAVGTHSSVASPDSWGSVPLPSAGAAVSGSERGGPRPEAPAGLARAEGVVDCCGGPMLAVRCESAPATGLATPPGVSRRGVGGAAARRAIVSSRVAGRGAVVASPAGGSGRGFAPSPSGVGVQFADAVATGMIANGGSSSMVSHAVVASAGRAGPSSARSSRAMAAALVAPRGGPAAFDSAPPSPRFERGSSMPARAAVVTHLEAGVGGSERASSRFRDRLATSAWNLSQLVAAIGFGIVIGKGAHLLMAEKRVTTWEPGTEAPDALRAEPRRVDITPAPDPTNTADSPLGSVEPGGTRHARSTRGFSAARGSLRSGAGARPTPPNSSRPPAACNLAPLSAVAVPEAPTSFARTTFAQPSSAQPSSAQPSSAQPSSAQPSSAQPSSARPSSALVSRLHPSSTPPLAAGGSSRACPSPPTIPLEPRAAGAAHVLPELFAAGSFQRAPVTGVPLAPASDDWLGEQLAILGRAERGLVDGDPEDVVRSLDEYTARFPDGLLDPQMASIRQRVEERFTAFIFP